MKKLIKFTLALLLLTVLISCDPNDNKAEKLSNIEDIFNISDDMNTEGKFEFGKKWKDKNGENFLIFTKKKFTTQEDDYDDDIHNSRILTYHFVKESNSYKLVRKTTDFIDDCMFDITLEVFPKSITITDLNNNGLAEYTYAYRLGCRSDVSPLDMKVLLLENGEKHAIRGEMKIVINDSEQYGGDYKIDNSFDKAPKEFKDHAIMIWNKFMKESFE